MNVPKWSLRNFLKSLKMLKFREFGSESNWIGSEHFVIELVSLEDLTWRIWRSDQFPKPLSYLSVSLFQATQPGFMLSMLGSFPHAFRTWIKVLMTSSTDMVITWIFTSIRKMFIKMTHRKLLSLSERGFTIKEHCWAFSIWTNK